MQKNLSRVVVISGDQALRSRIESLLPPDFVVLGPDDAGAANADVVLVDESHRPLNERDFHPGRHGDALVIRLTEDAGQPGRATPPDAIPIAILDGDRLVRTIRHASRERDLVAELAWNTALLEDSEERFRALVQHSSDVIELLDRDGVQRYASPSIRHVLGYEPSEIAGTSLADFVHPDDLSSFEGFLLQVGTAPGEPVTLSFRARNAAGAWIDVEASGNNRLGDPAVEGIVLNLRDITDRTAVARRLHQSETRLRMLVEQLPAVVWTTDRDLRITSSRGRGLSLMDSFPGRIVGMTIHQLFGTEDPEARAVAVHLAALGGEASVVESYPWRGRVWDCYIEPLRDEAGHIAGVIGLTLDVTGREEAAARLRNSEEQYRTIVEVMNEGLIVVDRDYTIRFVNDQVSSFVGLPRDKLIGQSPEILARDAETVALLARQFEQRRDGTPSHHEMDVVDREGRVLRVLLSSAPYFDARGQFAGSVTLLTNISPLKEAEREISRREARLRLLVEQVPAMIWTVDRDLVYTSSRGAALARLGLHQDELAGVSIREQVRDQTVPETLLPMHLRALEGENVSGTTILAGRTFETTLEPIREAGGQITGVFGFAIDVTEQHRAAARTRIQFAVTNVLVDAQDEKAAIDGVLRVIATELNCQIGLLWRRNAHDILEAANAWCEPEFEEFVTMSRGHQFTRGLGFPGRVWAAARAEVVSDFGSDPTILRAEAAASMGLKGACAFPLFVESSLIGVAEFIQSNPMDFDSELLATLEDVGRRVGIFLARSATLHQLRRSRAMLADAQRIGKLGSWEDDLVAGRVEWSNETYHIFGIDPDEPVPTLAEIFELVHPADRERIREIVERGNREQTPYEYEFRILRKDGEVRHLHTRADLIVENGRTLRVIGTVLDRTEPKRLQEQVERANRLSSLGRVAASVAHEFNNVLMGISPFAETLGRSAADERGVQAAKQIKLSVARGKRITSEILRFAQPGTPSMETIEVNAWLQRIAAELGEIVPPPITLGLKLAEREIAICGDSHQLTQVITNLVINARDAITGNGTIELASSEASNGQIVVSISDTGAGMDDATAAHVFEPFFTTKKSGTGLGLSVVQQIVRAHQGEITVDTQRGKGTCFRVMLPPGACAEASETVLATTPARQTKHGARVLLIEDDEAVANGVSGALQSDGFDVRVTPTAAAGLAQIDSLWPEIVITDIGLPDMDGMELVAMIRDRGQKLPIIIASGHSGRAAMKPNIPREGIEFLQKPFEMSQLVTLIQTLLHRT